MIRRQRTPRIVDNGHGWRTDAIAYEKASRIAQAIRFPKGWWDQFGTGDVYLSPVEVATATSVSCSDGLHEFELKGGSFQYDHVATEAQSNDLTMLFKNDMTESQRHWLGQPWKNKTNATRTVLTCRRNGRNAPEGLVVFERKMDLIMEGKEFWLNYSMELNHVYVLSGSRGNSIGHALVAPIALNFRDEVRHLRKALDEVQASRIGHLAYCFTLGGDIASDGGRAVYDGLLSAMTADASEAFTTKQLRENLISSPVDEDTEDMYFDPEAPADTRIRQHPLACR